jgi:hypothetical protein
MKRSGDAGGVLFLSQKRIARFREHFSLPDLLPSLEPYRKSAVAKTALTTPWWPRES